MEIILTTQFWLSLLTLTLLEIVLGVDNLVFISIISNDVPQKHQKITRRLGLMGALLMRLIFLAGIFWIIGLTKPLFNVLQHSFSLRDVVLLFGGGFLLVKATMELHASIEGDEGVKHKKKKKTLWFAVIQIMLFDIVFSLDSIFTAVGLTNHYLVMAIAIMLAIVAMMFASEILHQFIQKHPTVKILALSFLLLIGVLLIADSFGAEIPREYVYFSIAFSIFVEFINSLARRRKKKLQKLNN